MHTTNTRARSRLSRIAPRANTMKAVRIHEYGGPDVLRFEAAPFPQLADNEVLVRVHAAGVNPIDWQIREGYGKERFDHRLPLIPGWDLSGTVEGVGRGVNSFGVGDEVYGYPTISRDGAYAEHITVRVDHLALKPRSIDHIHAAATPVAALAAWQALFEAPAPFSSIGLTKGQTILIHGGSGGVGHFAVQLARWRGARVIATGSSRNEAFVRGRGADRFVDYTTQRFEDAIHGVDAVLDTVGGETLQRSWSVLKPGGVLASIVDQPSPAEAKARGVRAVHLVVQPNVDQLDTISRLIDAKIIAPIVSEVLPLGHARQAQQLSRSGHMRGKIVLDIAA